MFQRGGETHHFIESLGLDAFGLRSILQLRSRKSTSEVRFDVFPDFAMPLSGESAGHPAPHDPEFDPYRLLLGKVHPLLEQFGRPLCTPFVERIPKAWTQRVTQHLKEHAFVI